MKIRLASPLFLLAFVLVVTVTQAEDERVFDDLDAIVIEAAEHNDGGDGDIADDGADVREPFIETRWRERAREAKQLDLQQFGQLPVLKPTEYQPCLTKAGRLGNCTSLNKCYPYFKIFTLESSDTWVMGSYDTCSYYGPTGRHAFGVCCAPGGAPPSQPGRPEEEPSEEDDLPIEAQVINQNCGKRFFRNEPQKFKIVNGLEANQHEFPFMAALLNRNRQFCGGSLIDNRHILTAAHCVAHMSKYDVQNLRVNLGDHRLHSSVDTQEIVVKKVKRVIRHKGFDTQTLHNDVGILTLDSNVTLTRTIQPICLAIDTNEDYVGESVEVAGWGTLKEGGKQSSRLNKVKVKVWSNDECKRSYGSKAPGGITKHMICANERNKDSCSGDSGGPLFECASSCTQMGIVSWGIGCAQAKYPGVYTRVTEMLPWIQRIIRKY